MKLNESSVHSFLLDFMGLWRKCFVGKSLVEVWGQYLYNFGFSFDFCLTATNDQSIGHLKAWNTAGFFVFILLGNTLSGTCF